MTHREDPTGDEPVGSNIAAVEQVDGLTASSSPSGDSASRQQVHPAPGTYQRSTMPEVMILGLAGIAFVVALFILLWSGFNDAIGSQAGLLVGSFGSGAPPGNSRAGSPQPRGSRQASTT